MAESKWRAIARDNPNVSKREAKLLAYPGRKFRSRSRKHGRNA